MAVNASVERRQETGRLRHVLVVALSFPPSAAPAAIPAAHMAKFLPSHGWSPTFLTIRPGRLLMPHRAVNAYPLPPSGFRVHRTEMVYVWEALARLAWWRRRATVAPRGPTTEGAPAAGVPRRARTSPAALLEHLLKFPDVQCGWLPFAVLGGLAVARGRPVDCLYSIGPPWTSHLVGLVLHSLLSRPWIADFHDPWVANPWRDEARPRLLGWLEGRLEHQVLSSADLLVTKTPEMTALFAQCSGREEARDLATIPCAYDAQEIEAARSLAHRDRGKCVLVHAGRLYGRRSPVPLLGALALLAQEPDMARRFELRLVGEYDPGLQALAQRLGIADRVRQVGLSSHLETLRHILESDLALVVQPETTLQIPSKLYEYLGCGVPVLALANEGATARLVRQARGGVVVEPEDVDAIAAAIRGSLSEEGLARGPGPDEAFVRQFEVHAVIRQAAELLDRTARG